MRNLFLVSSFLTFAVLANSTYATADVVCGGGSFGSLRISQASDGSFIADLQANSIQGKYVTVQLAVNETKSVDEAGGETFISYDSQPGSMPRMHIDLSKNQSPLSLSRDYPAGIVDSASTAGEDVYALFTHCQFN